MSGTRKLEKAVGRFLVKLAGTHAGDLKVAAKTVRLEIRFARGAGATVSPALGIAVDLADDVFAARELHDEGTSAREVWSRLLAAVDETIEFHLAELMTKEVGDHG